MRLSLLFSLALGLIALLAVSERIPRWLEGDEALAKPGGDSVNSLIALPARLPADVRPPQQVASPSKEHGRIYKWRDARGSIHIATEPPPQNVQAVVIPFVRERPGKPTQQMETAAKTTAKTVADLSPAALMSVYTPEGFDDLLDRVEETARKLQQRNSQLEILKKQL